MRLICPNCGAQYEVDAGLIPPEGRDVQCSNCATTWFHEGSGRVAAEDVEVAEAASAPEPEPEAETPEPARRAGPAEDDGLDILREEAEQEARLRAGEADPLETQPELGLDDASVEDRAMANRARVMDDAVAEKDVDYGLGDDDPAPEIIAAPATPPEGRPGGSRRDLLPDIEEINSTLRPDERAMEDEDLDDDLREAIEARETKRHRGGLRAGFLTILFAAVAAVLAYVFAPQISAQVPQTEPPLTAYVSWVDTLRVKLDSGVRGLVEQLGNAAASASGNGGETE